MRRSPDRSVASRLLDRRETPRSAAYWDSLTEKTSQTSNNVGLTSGTLFGFLIAGGWLLWDLITGSGTWTWDQIALPFFLGCGVLAAIGLLARQSFVLGLSLGAVIGFIASFVLALAMITEYGV